MFESISQMINTVTESGISPQGELQTIQSLVALLIVATIVGVVASRIKIPYTVSLVVVGIALKALGVVPEFKLTHDLLMMVFLPALLFEAAIHFPASELKQFAPSIAMLALPGILLTALATAVLLQLEFSTFGLSSSVGFTHFLLFGTLIAATDPVSVITLLRQLGVNRRLSLLIEGESLFNDGTAIVLYSVVLNMITMGHFDLSESFIQLIVVSMGGVFVGAVLGLFSSLMISLMEDHLICIAITTVTAYGTYLSAEQLGVSGILAVVVAGLFVGNIGKKKGMNPNNRLAVVSFWEYVAFFIGSIVFLMMGLEVSMSLLIKNADLIVFAFCAVLASRAASVFLPLPLLRRMGQNISARSATVLWWAGLRGSLSMVLVLSLPKDMEVREVLIAMTFGVVVLSVVVQGTTMGPLLRWLGFVAVRTEASSFVGTHLAKLKAIKSQLEAVSRLSSQDLPHAKKIISGLQTERSEILGLLEAKSHEPDFIKATQERTSVIENHLRQVARESYREALEADLLTEPEALALYAELEEKSLASSHQTDQIGS